MRLLAARGALAPRALDQLALLLILQGDLDAEIASAAAATIEAIPRGALEAFLARTEVPGEMRAYFVERGVQVAVVARESEEPLIEVADGDEPADTAAEAAQTSPEPSGARRLIGLSVMQKMKVAMRGTREERGLLVRDPNRLVSAAVLSSPKLTENEVEGFARMANVSEDVLRVIGTTRAWLKNYAIAASLTRNPKTPIAISLHLLNRLTDRDVKMLVTDRNVPEPVRVAARKRVLEAERKRG